MSSFWLLQRPLVLASKSQARRALVAAAGLPFEAVEAQVDERGIEATLVGGGDAHGARVAAALAREKSLDVGRRSPGRLVLGGDQTLALGNQLLTKPADMAAARGQLLAMSGRSHRLFAALCLSKDGEVVAEAVADARLFCRAFTPAFLDSYLDLAGASVLSSVGGYAVEGLGMHLFDRVEGEHSTILGLPMFELLRLLRDLGAVAR